MSRMKVLLALLGVALLATVLVYVFTDASGQMSDMFQSTPQIPVRSAASSQRTTSAPKPKPVFPMTASVRELPRQAMMITQGHVFQLPVIDYATDLDAAGTPPVLDVNIKELKSARDVAADVVDASGNTVQELPLPLEPLVENFVNYAKEAKLVEGWSSSEFGNILQKQSEHAALIKTSKDTEAPVPPEIEASLSKIDPQSAFLAARQLHALISESGESSARLVALVRAYSNLGEATRKMFSAQSAAFFCRAMVFAERLTREYPESSVAHAARGYAYTLFGETLSARAAFDRAKALSPTTPLPDWALLAEDLNYFRTESVLNRMLNDGADQSLATYFSLLTIEHSGFQSAVVTSAKLAQEQTPKSVRILNIISDNSGVSIEHGMSEMMWDVQCSALGALANDPNVPSTIQTAAKSAEAARFAPPEVLALFAAMKHEPAQPGQLLPWSVYAAMQEDAIFNTAFRRLYFVSRMLATDAEDDLKHWQPYLQHHRYAVVLTGFDRSGPNRSAKAIAALKMLGKNDFFEGMPSLTRTATELNPNPPRAWRPTDSYEPDTTTYDTANQLWTYRDKDFDELPFFAFSKGSIAPQLLEMCPEHPTGLAEIIVNRWGETKNRAATIEKESAGNPQVAFALVRAYASERRYADAQHLLERVIKFSREPQVYEALAETYRQQNDVDHWLSTYEEYLSKTEDLGLDHARKNEHIANVLIAMDKDDRALPYARAAAESGSSWGLDCLANCLTKLGQFDEAEKLEQMNQSRYPGSFAWYRWCQATGHGDLAAARTASAEIASDIQSAPEAGNSAEAAIFWYLEGKLDRTAVCLQHEFDHRQGAFPALMMALVDIETKKPEEEIRQDLSASQQSGMPAMPAELMKAIGNVTLPADEAKQEAYEMARIQIERCLDDPDAVPDRDGDVQKKVLDATDTFYRGNVACMFGRLCELRGKTDDAKWWYRQAVDTHFWNFTLRPVAGAGLRRLGEKM